jgi:hypothetical protein
VNIARVRQLALVHSRAPCPLDWTLVTALSCAVRPVDPVTYAEAGHILGVTASSVRRRVLAGQLRTWRSRQKHRTLSRADVEALALRTYPYRAHIGDPGSYWVTGQRAADILGVNMARVRQLAHGALIPAEHPSIDDWSACKRRRSRTLRLR